MSIIKKIKSFFKAPSEVKRLEGELLLSRKLTDEFRELYKQEKERRADPRMVVEKIFNKEVKWFDYKELTASGQRQYFQEAQTILKSEVFNNIFNQIIATQCVENIRQWNPVTRLDVVYGTQMLINGLDLLKEELQSIPDPDKITKAVDVEPLDPYKQFR